MFHLTLLTFVEQAEDGGIFGRTVKARQDFPQSITVDSIKGLGQVYCLSMKIMSTVPPFDLNSHWLSGVFCCAIFWSSLFGKTPAKILPAMKSRVLIL